MGKAMFQFYMDAEEHLVWQWPGRKLIFCPGCVYIAGILNVTPDSFSDGGQFLAPQAAVAQGIAQAAGGADIVDIGGQSTRPGHLPVTEAEELARIMPVLQSLRQALPAEVLLSLDTANPAVAERVLSAGLADMLNDESGGDPRMAKIAAACRVPLILMHRPQGKDRGSLAAVQEDLAAMTKVYSANGLDQQQLAWDPGLGFGKTAGENLALLAGVAQLSPQGNPVYIGASRKSFIGKVTQRAQPDQRLGGSLAVALWAAMAGAAFLRVHDVAETKAALRMLAALQNGKMPNSN